MAYVRKTRDVYVLCYDGGYGWEELFEEDTYKEAREQMKTYRENQPQYRYKIKKKRVKIVKE